MTQIQSELTIYLSQCFNFGGTKFSSTQITNALFYEIFKNLTIFNKNYNDATKKTLQVLLKQTLSENDLRWYGIGSLNSI